MYDKTKIFNLALSALYLQKRLSNADTDNSTEALTLNNLWETAFFSALQEMDLDSTSSTKELELVTLDPNKFWKYAYKYPTDCKFLRRIVSCYVTDDEYTNIDRKIEIMDGQKVILTNQQEAMIEYISSNVPMASLSAEAALFISYKLAKLATPLIVGKNSQEVMKTLERNYQMALLDAQEKDALETTIYQPEWMKSGLAKARLS